MLTYERRGIAWDIKNAEGVVILTLLHTTKKGVTGYYHWLSSRLLGTDLNVICQQLEQERTRARV